MAKSVYKADLKELLNSSLKAALKVSSCSNWTIDINSISATIKISGHIASTFFNTNRWDGCPLQIFKEYLKAQNELEKRNETDIDIAAEPTAKMLSSLFALCSPDGETRALERLGYVIGRWIYILDAAADLEKDIKKNRYNPFKSEIKENNINEFLKQRVLPSLNMCIGEAENAFELLNIERFKNILGNIIYVGLEESQNAVIFKEKVK